MKSGLHIAAAIAVAAGIVWAEKLTVEDKIELTRGLTAEYATAKVALPRSKKPLEVEQGGTYDKAKWLDAGRENGPAARVGDLVQITKIDIDNDRIVFEINNGMKSGKHWYDHVQIGMGTSTRPVSNGQATAAPGGTLIALLFPDGVQPMKAADVKKMLAPILDFEKHSATEQYVDTLPPEIKAAVAEKKAIPGMDRDQVLLAMGRPDRKTRETKDGLELEDWIYGKPPGKITFVTFQGSKVSKVKDTYAGLGGSTAEPQPVP
jgi:hypothetical protein